MYNEVKKKKTFIIYFSRQNGERVKLNYFVPYVN